MKRPSPVCWFSVLLSGYGSNICGACATSKGPPPPVLHLGSGGKRLFNNYPGWDVLFPILRLKLKGVGRGGRNMQISDTTLQNTPLHVKILHSSKSRDVFAPKMCKKKIKVFSFGRIILYCIILVLE